MADPQESDRNRGGSLLAMVWTEVPIAAIFVTMRMYSRLKLRNLGWDDWMMVITLVSRLILDRFYI